MQMTPAMLGSSSAGLDRHVHLWDPMQIFDAFPLSLGTLRVAPVIAAQAEPRAGSGSAAAAERQVVKTCAIA